MTYIYQKPIQYEEDGDILYAVVPTPKPAKKPSKRIIAAGQIVNGRIVKYMTADEYVARRAAQAGLTADHLANDEQKAIHAQVIEARHDEVHAFANELEAMDADLAALRAQTVPPLVSCQTLGEMYEVRQEEVGE